MQWTFHDPTQNCILSTLYFNLALISGKEFTTVRPLKTVEDGEKCGDEYGQCDKKPGDVDTPVW